MPHVIENDADAFTSGKPKGWNQITVAGCNHNKIHHFTKRQTGNVQTNPQINTLLLQIRHKILCHRGAGRGKHPLQSLVAQAPAVNHQFTFSYSKIRHQFKRVEQADVLPEFIGG